MTALPSLMVAPNGARLGKADHPDIPITLEEIVTTAIACRGAGADGLHLHLRDRAGKHILDAGLYREALAELTGVDPGLAVQITTEAVGVYSSDHQRDIALNSGAKLVSTSIRELMSDTDAATADRFFEACRAAEIHLQFILYDLADLELLKTIMPEPYFRRTRSANPFCIGPVFDKQR